MKILLASDCYIYQTCGVTSVVHSLAENLRTQGHDVKVLAPSYEMRSFKDGDHYYIKSISAFYYQGHRISYGAGDPLIKELTAWRPDIIHLHTEGGIAMMVDRINKSNPVPVIMTAHTNYPYYIFGKFRETRPARIASKMIGHIFLRRADHIIAPSEKVRSFPYLEPFSNRMRVIPNGIDLNKWKKSISPAKKKSLLRQLSLDDQGFTLITVSRLGKEKNIQELLYALPFLVKQRPEIRLLIVGDGPYRKKLEKICKRLKLSDHVCFTGMVPAEQVPDYLGLGDIFVSASEFEVHSIAYLEAMACGLPLVLKEDESIRGVLEAGKNGFSFRTTDEFHRAVMKLIDDRSLRGKMHEAALRAIEDFSDEKCAEKTLDLYREVLHKHER